MNLSKLRTKHNRYRCLKTISYLLGYPLLIVLVLVGSMTLFRSDAFDAVKWNGVIVCLALWLVSVVLQILISLITKNYNARTLVMVLVSLILVTGSAVAFDMLGEKQFEKAVDEYKEQAAEHGVFDFEIKDFKYHTGFFDTWTKDKDSSTDEYIDMLNDFTYAYNVEYKSKNYGKVNGDGSKITYDKKADAWYSENGLFADGYRFGVKQALQVLIDYNEAKFAVENKIVEEEIKDKDGKVISTVKKVVSTKKKVDVELQNALDALDTDSEWLAYKRSEEYVAAYGKDGSAFKFMLNEERLNKILQAMSKKLNQAVSADETLEKVISELLGGFGLSMNDISSLSVDKIVEIINRLGLFAEPMTNADLMKLLEDFSFYQVPTVKPKFAFLKDETLKKYAYANYYATVHGANIASVLVGDFIGQVTMDNKGHIGDTYKENNIIYKRDEAGKIVYEQTKNGKDDMTKPIILYSYDGVVYSFNLSQLYELRAKTELYTKFYPLMAARRYAYTATGFIALGFVLFYYYKRKEDEAFGLFANTGMGGKF